MVWLVFFFSRRQRKRSIQSKHISIALIILLKFLATTSAACSSCVLMSVTGAGIRVNHHRQHQFHRGGSARSTVLLNARSGLMYLTSQRIATHFGHTLLSHSDKSDEGVKRAGTENGDDEDSVVEADGEKTATERKDKVKMPVSGAMVGAIGVYKNFISPLLPPACRFFPTCSQYGVQAIEDFGANRGCILTAWRLLRCSPLGGKGYDPPKWPPVSYTYSSY